jgi:hypothetical protein
MRSISSDVLIKKKKLNRIHRLENLKNQADLD